MTGSRLLSKLLRFKGVRVVSWWFEGRSCFVIGVCKINRVTGDRIL